mgnify:CR=1 FL=1
MLGNMMEKLQEMKQKSNEVKERLAHISVEGEAENGTVKVVADGNRKITEIKINQALIQEGDKEQIEELTLLAINRALEKAEKVAEAEMQDVAKGFLPGM